MNIKSHVEALNTKVKTCTYRSLFNDLMTVINDYKEVR